MTLGIITLFFSGGLIPYYLLLRNLGFLDKFIVYIIPAMFSFYDAIIFIAFLEKFLQALKKQLK
ncbi:hypothetical protein [Caloramator sp. Dgby_cultured_2]|uniref:hypothetical protein n=1 Tax=Caloramator sp. Dgby_cultured_2 TaxID=3029174 RepID=UPI00237D3396|nr:hypothetical protein [Caloramator sp. Dgby_cultured_2]WDU82916.1 hypothetical protein PWK10_15985 [Caloramator sp. Dgby_cultured_2]